MYIIETQLQFSLHIYIFLYISLINLARKIEISLNTQFYRRWLKHLVRFNVQKRTYWISAATLKLSKNWNKMSFSQTRNVKIRTPLYHILLRNEWEIYKFDKTKRARARDWLLIHMISPLTQAHAHIAHDRGDNDVRIFENTRILQQQMYRSGKQNWTHPHTFEIENRDVKLKASHHHRHLFSFCLLHFFCAFASIY